MWKADLLKFFLVIKTERSQIFMCKGAEICLKFGWMQKASKKGVPKVFRWPGVSEPVIYYLGSF